MISKDLEILAKYRCSTVDREHPKITKLFKGRKQRMFIIHLFAEKRLGLIELKDSGFFQRPPDLTMMIFDLLGQNMIKKSDTHIWLNPDWVKKSEFFFEIPEDEIGK